MKLALDVDNTLNKLSFYFLQELEFKYNIKLIEKEPFNDDTNYKYYEFKKYTNCNEDEMSKIQNDIFSNYNFWINIPLINKNIVEFISLLNEKLDLYFVTYPYKFYEGAVNGKVDWLRKSFPFIQYDQIILRNKLKHGVKDFNILIDDNPVLLENAFKDGVFTIKYNHKYNEDAPYNICFNKWSVDFCEKLYMADSWNDFRIL